MYFYNLSYDAGAIIKTLPEEAIGRLMYGDTVMVDTETNELTDRVERVRMLNRKWTPKSPKSVKKYVKVWRLWNEDKTKHTRINFNRYIKITYLPKKWLGIERRTYARSDRMDGQELG